MTKNKVEREIMIRRVHERLKGYYIFVLVFILWIVICKLEIWNQYIMPTPQKVYTTFKKMIIDGSILKIYLLV